MKVPTNITVEPGWYTRGSHLLQATLSEWNAASWRDALGACSLWVRAAAALAGKPAEDVQGQIGVYCTAIDFQQADLLDYSAGLLRALAQGAAHGRGELKISELANLAVFQLGWLQIKSPEVPE